jgi:hypothetical protein
MHRRPITKNRPGFERLEDKQLLSAGTLASHSAGVHIAEARPLAVDSQKPHDQKPTKFLAFRVTNTAYPTSYPLVPPFQQVLVQSNQPVPGQVYNVLQIALKNGTSQTFNASSDFKVKLTTQRQYISILTGTQEWKPKQVIIFYVLTKQYYPLPEVSGGFEFDLGGANSTLVPGPSAIFLRIKYNPARFANTLNWIVAYGPGNEGGAGSNYGLPNTSINEFVAASTSRNDFGGRY